MDHSETLALKFLDSLNLGPISFEPDGNIPPDFLIGNRIAVEVRRLNQHWINSEGESQGLENDQFAVVRLIRRLTVEIGPPTQGKSWFVIYRFSRPLLPLRKLTQAIREYLIRFRDGYTQSTEFIVGGSFHLRLLRATDLHTTCFLLGGASDRNSGGFVGGLLAENIKFCLREKERKIAAVRHKYPEWWLVLIDLVSYGMWEPLSLQHSWDKLILLDPQNPVRAYDLSKPDLARKQEP